MRQLLDKVVDVPVFVVVSDSVEVPQLQFVGAVQFFDKVADVPVVAAHSSLLGMIVVCQCHRSWDIIKVIAGCRVVTVQKTVEVPQFLFLLAMRTRWLTCPLLCTLGVMVQTVQFLDKVVAVPVVVVTGAVTRQGR